MLDFVDTLIILVNWCNFEDQYEVEVLNQVGMNNVNQLVRRSVEMLQFKGMWIENKSLPNFTNATKYVLSSVS